MSCGTVTKGLLKSKSIMFFILFLLTQLPAWQWKKLHQSALSKSVLTVLITLVSSSCCWTDWSVNNSSWYFGVNESQTLFLFSLHNRRQVLHLPRSSALRHCHLLIRFVGFSLNGSLILTNKLWDEKIVLSPYLALKTINFIQEKYLCSS